MQFWCQLFFNITAGALLSSVKAGVAAAAAVLASGAITLMMLLDWKCRLFLVLITHIPRYCVEAQTGDVGMVFALISVCVLTVTSSSKSCSPSHMHISCHFLRAIPVMCMWKKSHTYQNSYFVSPGCVQWTYHGARGLPLVHRSCDLDAHHRQAQAVNSSFRVVHHDRNRKNGGGQAASGCALRLGNQNEAILKQTPFWER
jgi:hypothetical protein